MIDWNKIIDEIKTCKRNEENCGCMPQEGCGCYYSDFNDGLEKAIEIIRKHNESPLR